MMNTTIQTDSPATVEKQEVSFLSNGLKIKGILHMPQGIDAGVKTHPAIVISHPAGGVKEQTAGLYADLLAVNGFITLTFDTAYQGESEGMPRGLENPAQRIEDIKSAVTFLSTLEAVDLQRIGVLGICASGGYGISAAATDHRIKAIATVSPVDIGRQFRNGSDGKQSLDFIQGMLDLAAADRNNVAQGQEPGAFPIFPGTAEQAQALGEHGFEGWKYYCTDRGQHERSMKLMQWKSIEYIAGFDGFRFANLIAPRPLLIIAGSEAETLWMAKEAMEIANEPKELFIVDGASHVALYDKREFVDPAVAKLADFFKLNL